MLGFACETFFKKEWVWMYKNWVIQVDEFIYFNSLYKINIFKFFHKFFQELIWFWFL